MVFERVSVGFPQGFRLISACGIFTVDCFSGYCDFLHASISGFIYLFFQIGEFLDVWKVIGGGICWLDLMLSLLFFLNDSRGGTIIWGLFFLAVLC